MRYFNFIQILIVCVTRANCSGCKNHIEPYLYTEECGNNEHNVSNESQNPINDTNKATPMYPKHEEIRKFEEIPVPTKFHLTDTVVNVDEYDIRKYSSDPSFETDSIESEKRLKIATAIPTEYMEEFTTKGNLTETATWVYQYNKSSEESDESKSTLIDYPFSVSIQRKGSHYTTGALLDKWWIISSAGEFYHIRDTLKLFRARLGSVDCKRGGSLVPIKKIEIHPYYVPGKPNFDVALLRMAYFIDFSQYIRPIAISVIKGKVLSAKFMATYWPRIMVKGSALPTFARERISYNSMRVSMQRLIPQRKCAKLLKDINEILNESSLCLKPVLSHHSVCMPDIGAPVVAEDGLWGITSGWTSPMCPRQTAPTIFTRLSSPSVRSWLNTILNGL